MNRLKTRLTKIIVLWLLAVTVPVHGLAATLMPLMQAASPVQAHAPTPMQTMAVDHAHRHHHADQIDAPTLMEHAPHPGHDMKHCTACGACCMPALMAPPGAWPALHHQGMIVVQFLSPYRPGPVPDRLDRPPRHSFV